LIVLFVGDVVGSPGRRAVQRQLPGLVERHKVDYTIVNIENAAGGFGITPEVIAELDGLPIDCYTSGNHIWDKKEGMPLLEYHQPRQQVAQRAPPRLADDVADEQELHQRAYSTERVSRITVTLICPG